jgi:adenylate kinase
MVKVAVVFGVSGVGKSWLIARFGEAVPIAHAQASQLLRDARAEISGRLESQEELRQGAVLDNQALLIEAFAKFRLIATKPIIFDGHSVIDAGDRLVAIPVEAIRAIAPAGLIFIKDKPAAIVARRARDTTRSRPVRSDSEILDHQIRAQALCERYAEALDIPLTLVQAGDKAGFSSAIETILDVRT